MMRPLRSLALVAASVALLAAPATAGAVAADLHGTLTITQVADYDVTGVDGGVVGHHAARDSATFAIDRYVTLRFPTANFTPTDVVHTLTHSDDQGCIHEELGAVDTAHDPLVTTVPWQVSGDVQNRLTKVAVLSLATRRTIDQPWWFVNYTNTCGEPLVQGGSHTLFEGYESAGAFPGARSSGPLLQSDGVLAKVKFARTLAGTWKSVGSRTTVDPTAKVTTTYAWNLWSRNPSPSCALPPRRSMIGGTPTGVVALLRRSGHVPVIVRTSQLRNVARGRVAQVSYGFTTGLNAPCAARVSVYVRS